MQSCPTLCNPMDCRTLGFCPSPTSGVCPNSCPLSSWCHPTISSSVVPFSSRLQSSPASGSFPVSQYTKEQTHLPLLPQNRQADCLVVVLFLVYFLFYIALISHAGKVMLKILQARLQQYVNYELLDVQAGFRKGRGTRDQIANICWIMEKARVPKIHLFLLYWLCQSLWLCGSQ